MIQSGSQPRGSAVSVPKTREEIVAEIKRRITARTPGYLPGDQLPLQEALAVEFDVHRVTVSRAMADLIEEGLVVSRGRRGTYVAEDQSSGGPTT